MSDTVTIIRKNTAEGAVFRAHCNRCLKILRGPRGGEDAASKHTATLWAKDHLARHEFRATWPERMARFGWVVSDTIELP